MVRPKLWYMRISTTPRSNLTKTCPGDTPFLMPSSSIEGTPCPLCRPFDILFCSVLPYTRAIHLHAQHFTVPAQLPLYIQYLHTLQICTALLHCCTAGLHLLYYRIFKRNECTSTEYGKSRSNLPPTILHHTFSLFCTTFFIIAQPRANRSLFTPTAATYLSSIF